MSDSDELLFSPDAAMTRFLYFQGENDVNFFFEDEGKEYLYERIIERLFGDSIKIETVFCLGGKINVKKGFEEFGSETNSIKNFFIVDGDFDRYLYPEDMINNDSFIYLKTYNIESYYIDKCAFEQYAKGKLKCTNAVLAEKVNFEEWREEIVGQAKKLFLAYAFIKKYHPTIKSVDRNSYEFIDNKTGFERPGAYRKFLDEIKDLDDDFESKISEIAEKYEAINGDDYFNLICGKFLMDSLFSYLQNIARIPMRKDDFQWALINGFDISKLEYIKEVVIENIGIC